MTKKTLKMSLVSFTANDDAFERVTEILEQSERRQILDFKVQREEPSLIKSLNSSKFLSENSIKQ